VLILTNFVRFPLEWQTPEGLQGKTLITNSLTGLLRHSRRADLVIINCDTRLLLGLRAAYLLLPFLRRPILGHDIVLRKPLNWRARLSHPIKRFLFSGVDHYSLHFRDLEGYTRYFGIGPERASYVPFKPSIRGRDSFRTGTEGEYVLCLGWSERDYDTFFAAMERLPYPAAIPVPNFEQLRRHSSRFTRPLSMLPANVRLLEDDLSTAAMARMLEGARIVVLPTVSSRISASGIGTNLNAMYMRKCVITSHGPGSTDVLTGGEALLVPPEDPAALADIIQRAWEDDELRERTAAAGFEFASSLGTERELRERVLEVACRMLTGRLPRRTVTTGTQSSDTLG
jgi:glycosyltransferase involved in cell wall biosynthesis